jgi:quinol monooxygenase YgiN
MNRYGLVGSFKAKPGQGNELAGLLLRAAGAMGANPDCLLYIVSRSPDDPDLVWVTEAWTDEAAHAASLEDPAVRAQISEGRGLIAGMGQRFELETLGGKGLDS